jgi:hypothetical protein
MILETAILNVRSGQEAAFQSAMKAARPLISLTPGSRSLAVRRKHRDPEPLSAARRMAEIGGPHNWVPSSGTISEMARSA